MLIVFYVSMLGWNRTYNTWDKSTRLNHFAIVFNVLGLVQEVKRNTSEKKRS